MCSSFSSIKYILYKFKWNFSGSVEGCDKRQESLLQNSNYTGGSRNFKDTQANESIDGNKKSKHSKPILIQSKVHKIHMVLISDWLVTGLRKKPDLNWEPKNLNINNALSEKSELVSKVVNI